MAGRIKQSDIEEVKSRTSIVDIVGDHVALKSAGVDSRKGLCPFHDERSPSFHVRPSMGFYHCFGCGESGDAISFLQRMDHLSFAEAVERLAARIGYVLQYEEGGAERRQDGPNRARLLQANQAAADFFVEQLATPEAQPARDLLTGRNFDQAAAAHFGVGFAPQSWDALSKHLATLGYTTEEMVTAGLLSQGERGSYDRFRGRLVWPIRDTSGQTIGFGARKLFESDQGPKYLNTPETPVYHKSQVLYGLDLAKRDISRSKRVVVVEGYTDVMACHLAGITTAVATCGTAFGKEHISVVRRIMGDDAAGEVIFTFDPDEAGQKAALRAFSEERRFSAQSFVAVAPEGLDPCDLRIKRGDEAVRGLFEQKTPLFEFALRQAVSRFNLDTIEGRVSGIRAAAPIVAGIRDSALRPAYTRELARMVGADLPEVQGAVRAAARQSEGRGDADAFREAPRHGEPGPDGEPLEPARRRASLSSLPNSPGTWLERDALMAMIQQPGAVGEDILVQAVTAQIFDESLRVVRDVLGANLPADGGPAWLERTIESAPEPYRDLIRELAVAPMPQRNPEMLAAYSRDVVISLIERDLLSLKSELTAKMIRTPHTEVELRRQLAEQQQLLEQARRGLRDT